MIKNCLKAFLFLNILVLLLTISALIPQKSIHKNIYNYAYTEKDMRYAVFLNDQASTNDVFADASSLNIISLINSKQPIKSILKDDMYMEKSYLNSLKESLNNDNLSNVSYSRYWHGYMILWRCLLVFFNVNTIKILMGIIFVLLFIYFSFLCFKEKIPEFCIFYLLSIILSKSFFAFVSLEYILAMFIPLIFCIVYLKTKISKEFLFMLSGISIAFFDFLTIEVLSFIIPFLLVSYKEKISIIKSIKYAVLFGLSYVFTFIYKFLLLFIFNLDNFESQANYIFNWISIKQIGLALILNIKMLFSNNLNTNVTTKIFLGFLLLYIILFYLFRKTNLKFIDIQNYLFVLILILMRFTILSNHCVVHYFFTYRLFLGVFLSLFLMFYKNKMNNFFCLKQNNKK